MTYEIRANEQFGSLEIFFEGKPGDKIREALKGLNEQIEALRNESLKCYTFTSYYGQPENSKLKTYSVVRLADSYEWNPGRYADYKDLAELDTEDRERIAAGLEKVKEDFTKRLNTY